MIKKIITLGVALTLIFSGMLVAINNNMARPVEDEIKATVQPGDSIQDAIDNATAGDTIYVWNGTYNEKLIINKTISLVGNHSASTIIQGNGTGDVVYVDSVNWFNMTGFTITNSGIDSSDYGLNLYHSDYCRIENNVFDNNENHMRLYSADYNTIAYNSFTSAGYRGIWLLAGSDHNSIDNNIFENFYTGIAITSSQYNTMSNNSFSLGSNGIYHYSGANNNLIINNTFTTFNFDGIHFWSGTGNQIIDNQMSKCDNGIYLRSPAYHNHVEGNTLFNNTHGLSLNNDDGHSVIINNNISFNDYGIYVLGSHNNTIEENEIWNNTDSGIYIENSPDNLINGNNIWNNSDGIYIQLNADNNVLTDNGFSHNSNGTRIKSSYGNTISGNTLFDNDDYGMYLTNSTDNVIYHNIFIDNYDHSYDDGVNDWNAPYPTGGNYWAGLTGPDDYRGVNQDIWGPDGIVDNNRTIDGGDNVDNYPWTNEDFLHEYQLNELLMDPSEQTYVMVGDTITVTATAWDQDLNLPIPGVELEFGWYDWGQAGNASFESPHNVTTDENGTAEVIFNPGNETGDYWVVYAENETDLVLNQTETIQVVEFRGDLAIYDENQYQWVGEYHYEEEPNLQIVNRSVAKGGSVEFEVRMINTGSVEDTLVFSWDNSTFPVGWKMNVTTNDPDTWDEIDITDNGSFEIQLLTDDYWNFFINVHADPGAGYEDRVHVNISVLDSGNQYDNGTLEAYIPTPDVMWMSIAWDEEEALDPAHDGPPLPLNDSVGGMNLPPNMWLPLWGVLYNSTTQSPVEVVSVDWILINEGGAAASIDPVSGSNNESVWLNTGPSAGEVTLSASYEVSPGVWWNDSWTFNVTVGWDYVLITDAPDGTEIPDQDVEFASTMELWASVYNDTHGFVTTTIMSEWDYDGEKIMSTDWFMEGGVEVQFIGVGETLVELYVDTPDGTLYDNVTFNISQPDVDFIQITDIPDGNWLWGDWVDVGQYRWYNVSAYNDELGWGVYLPDIDQENIHWDMVNEFGSTGELEVIDGMAKIYTGRTGGRINITASYYDEEQDQWFYSNELHVHVSEPRVDDIAISYTPDGENLVESGTIAYGTNMTGYACAWNNSIGFIGLMNGNWDVNNNGGVSSTTSPAWGNESVFIAETDPSQTGDSWWDLEVYDGNYDTWHNYNVNFQFLSVDWINITYFNGTVVSDYTQVIVDGELELYVSAYNWTQSGDHRIGFLPVSWLLTNDGNTEGNLNPTDDSIWTNVYVGTVTGDILINVTYGGMEDSVPLEITADTLEYVRIELQDGSLPSNTYSADETTTVYLRGYDQYDNLIGNIDGNWDLDGDNATLSADTGTSVTVDWKLVGTVTLSAEHGGLLDEITVTVTHGVVDSIEVTPAGAEITADDTQQFEAKGYDAEGNEITGLTFTWGATNGTISAGGLFTPWSAEDVTISANWENITETVTITVTPGMASSVIISPDEAQTVDPGDEIVFTAEAFDSNNNLITDTVTDFTWQNADNGVFSEEEPGDYDVTATYDGVTSSATTVTVVSTDPYFEVTITSSDETVMVGETVTVQYTVENTGEEGTQDIVFTVDGTEEDVYTGLTLDAGAEYNGEFTWQTDAAGEYDFTITSDDSSDSGIVTVEESTIGEAYFRVTITDYDDLVIIGEDITVGYNIQNLGGVAGTQGIVFNVNGNQVDVYSELTLEAEEEYNGVFTWQADEVGEHNLTVSSDDQIDSVTVTVNADDEVPSDDDDEPIDSGFMDNFWWILPLLVIIIIVALVLIKKRGKGPIDDEGDEDVDPNAQDYNSTRSNRGENEFGGPEDEGFDPIESDENIRDVEQSSHAEEPADTGD
ncbi:MAG: NosD domain-containing protein [Thermoplasmata archaeon]